MTFALMHPIYHEMDFTLGPTQRTLAPNMANVTKFMFFGHHHLNNHQHQQQNPNGVSESVSSSDWLFFFLVLKMRRAHCKSSLK